MNDITFNKSAEMNFDEGFGTHFPYGIYNSIPAMHHGIYY